MAINRVIKENNFLIWLRAAYAALLILHFTLVEKFGEIFQNIPLIIGIIVFAFSAKEIKVTKETKKIFATALFLFLSAIISVLYSIDIYASIFGYIGYAKAIMLYLLLVSVVRTSREIEIQSLSVFFSLSIAAFYSLFIGSKELIEVNLAGEFVRASSVRGDPNDSAMVLLIGIPIGIHWILKTRISIKSLAMQTCLGLIVACLISTGSRGGLMAAFLEVLLLLYVFRNRRIIQLIVIACITLAIILTPESYYERYLTISQLTEKNTTDGSLQGRYSQFEAVVAVFVDNPLFGLGPNIFTPANGYPDYAHSMILQVLTDFGLIGLIFWITLIWFPLRELTRFRNTTKDDLSLKIAIAIGCTAMTTAGFFLPQAQSSILWLMMGLGVAANSVHIDRLIGRKY